MVDFIIPAIIYTYLDSTTDSLFAFKSLCSDIFNTIKSMNPKSVTIFLDACYSGQTREKDMILADARPITIVHEEDSVPEDFTVFSASSGSEISGSLPEADHGLFNYFLMKGLEGDADENKDNNNIYPENCNKSVGSVDLGYSGF